MTDAKIVAESAYHFKPPFFKLCGFVLIILCSLACLFVFFFFWVMAITFLSYFRILTLNVSFDFWDTLFCQLNLGKDNVFNSKRVAKHTHMYFEINEFLPFYYFIFICSILLPWSKIYFFLFFCYYYVWSKVQ